MARRIITGKTADGTSVFVSDEQAPELTLALIPGTVVTSIWSSETIPVAGTDGTLPNCPTYFPPPGGVRYGLWTFPPDESAGTLSPDFDIVGALDELEAKLPGMAAHLEPEAPGMHTTQTVDIGLVLSGEIDLELDDGATVHLTQGDFVVQNGTRHAWRNRSGRPTTMVFVLVGARPT